MSCRGHGFHAGQVFLYESLGLFREAGAVLCTLGDDAGLLALCERRGTPGTPGGDPELWRMALEHFAARRGLGASDAVRDLLRTIEARSLLGPLAVLEVGPAELVLGGLGCRWWWSGREGLRVERPGGLGSGATGRAGGCAGEEGGWGWCCMLGMWNSCIQRCRCRPARRGGGQPAGKLLNAPCCLFPPSVAPLPDQQLPTPLLR